MAQANHLGTIEVAAQSAGKSTAADDSDNQISQAIADRANILISTTSPVTVAASVYTRAYEFKLTNDGSPPVADFTVQFAARTNLHRGQIKVVNNTAFTATLEVTGQSSPKPTLEMGQTGYYDLFATEVLEGPGSGSTSAGDWKDSVRATTTANGILATAYENGDTIDGVALATGDRILLKDQTAGAENGIYVVAATGAPSRASDADTDGKVTSGLSVHVEEGSSNANKNFQLTTNDPITLDTTALVFSEFSGGVAGGLNGLSDVTITSAAEGDMLLRDGTDWKNTSINDLTEDTTPDKSADYVMTWDTSAGVPKKSKITNTLGSNIEVSVKRIADLTGQDHATAPAAIAFNDENYDTDTWHDNSTNPSRLTVPAGVTTIDIAAHIKVTNITADEWVLIQLYKNGTAIDALSQRVQTGGTERNVSLTALGVECVATDYFEVYLEVETDTSVDVDADSTFIARASISGGTNNQGPIYTQDLTSHGSTTFIVDLITDLGMTAGDVLDIVIVDARPTSDASDFYIEVSDDDQSTWESTNYQGWVDTEYTGSPGNKTTVSTNMPITNPTAGWDLNSDIYEGYSGTIRLYNLADALVTRMVGFGMSADSAGGTLYQRCISSWKQQTVVTDLRFTMSSNMSAGKVLFYIVPTS